MCGRFPRLQSGCLEFAKSLLGLAVLFGLSVHRANITLAQSITFLFDRHADLFPGVRGTGDRFRVGAWRDDSQGTMQVVSGPVGRHKVHYVAPAAACIESEIGSGWTATSRTIRS